MSQTSTPNKPLPQQHSHYVNNTNPNQPRPPTLSEPELKRQKLLSSARSCSHYNSSLLRDRYLKGPCYYERHTGTTQVLGSWKLNICKTPNPIYNTTLSDQILQQRHQQISKQMIQNCINNQNRSMAQNQTNNVVSQSLTNRSLGKRKSHLMEEENKFENCLICKMKGKEGEILLTCYECSKLFHPGCLFPEPEYQHLLNKAKTEWLTKNNWRCPNCKVCEVCGGASDEDKMLFCEDCDHGYHTFCCSPPLKKPPTGKWWCSSCKSCVQCGGTSTYKWRMNGTMCEACYHLWLDKKYCPICQRVYRISETAQMIRCLSCRSLIHLKCDQSLPQDQDPSQLKVLYVNYRCPLCLSSITPTLQPLHPTEGVAQQQQQ